jgi:hypothetical protein
VNSHRAKVIDALHVLSSKDAQYDLLCQSEDQPDRESRLHLANALWTGWIQETYAPRQIAFASAFPPEGLEALERFTEFFRARLPLFPTRFESLMTDKHWLSVIEYANVLLEKLAHDDVSTDDGA